MRWMIRRFPDLERPIRALAAQHLELKDEPLHLALAYDPGRDSQDVFLFELLSHFGRDEVSPEGELFEVTFPSSPELPLVDGQRMHLVLTSPSELKVALRQGWSSALELQAAVAKGDFDVLFEDELGRKVIRDLQSGSQDE